MQCKTSCPLCPRKQTFNASSRRASHQTSGQSAKCADRVRGTHDRSVAASVAGRYGSRHRARRLRNWQTRMVASRRIQARHHPEGLRPPVPKGRQQSGSGNQRHYELRRTNPAPGILGGHRFCHHSGGKSGGGFAIRSFWIFVSD
jgi:hypothetical protein